MKQRRRTKTKNAPTANAESDEIDDTAEDLAGGSSMERAKREVEAMGKVLAALDTLPDDETRRRSLAAAAILLGVVSPDCVIRELRRAGVGGQ